MKSTSASLYGNWPSPGGVAWRPCAGAPAHAAVAAARSRDATRLTHDRRAAATVSKRNAPMGADYRSGEASFELLYLRRPPVCDAWRVLDGAGARSVRHTTAGVSASRGIHCTAGESAGDEGVTWRSSEAAHSRPAKGPPIGSPVRSGSIRCSTPPDPARAVGASVTFEPGARTAWHTHPLGQTLIVTAGSGLAQRMGRTDRADSAGRRGLVLAGREALARRDANDGHDAHRHSGEVEWQGGGLDGTGQRRAVPGAVRP